MQNKKFLFIVPSLVAVALAFGSVPALAFTPLVGAFGLGAQGVDVTNLQTFLASNNVVYPQALVTGHFGPLTEEAVEQFQIGYGLPLTESVDAQTMQVINNLINSGKSIDVNAPVMSAVSVAVTNQTATLSWNNSEIVTSKVFYSASPIGIFELPQAKVEPLIGGQVFVDSSLGFSKAVVLQGLQPSTLYYYVAEAVDAAGNVTVALPQIFRTTP